MIFLHCGPSVVVPAVLRVAALISNGWEVVGIANSEIGSQGGPGVDSKECVPTGWLLNNKICPMSCIFS